MKSILFSRGKKVDPKTRYYTYTANPSYTGTHPTSNFSTSVYLKEVSLDIEIQADLIGASDTLEYPISIHAYDPSAMYGYSPIPTLVLGEYKGGIPLIKTLSSYDFTSFVNEFKGYVIVQDPLNLSNDTSKCLIFGKIGSDW